MHFSQKRELFLFPITTLLPSLIVCHFFICPFESHCSSFVFPSPARAARTVFCSFFVRSLFVLCSFFVRLLFVFCSSFLYLLVRLAPSFVRLIFPLLHSLSLGEGWGEDIFFVHSLSACVARTCPCGSHLPVRLAPSLAFNLVFLALLALLVLN